MKPRVFIVLALGFVSLASARGLTLDEALARALEKNPRIQQAKSGGRKSRRPASRFSFHRVA